MVPHLVTALTGPLGELEQRVIDSTPAIERWFRLEWMEHTPPFYCSTDIRNSGFKIAPVDTNLFPGGWHYLSEPMLPLAVQAAMAAIEKICPEARNLLVIPENRCRSAGYVDNLLQLQHIFRMAGLNVRFGSINPEIAAPVEITSAQDAERGGVSVLLEPVVRSQNRLGLKHFDPCTILLNHDLSSGVPGILEDLAGQYLLPPLHAGWSSRRKSRHFQSYEEVCKRFGKLLGMDHWLIYPQSAHVEAVDFNIPADVQRLAAQVDAVLNKVRRKYKEYGIKDKPFVMVKADNGTAGCGVMTVRDAKELHGQSPEHWKALGLDTPADGAIPDTGHDLIIQEGVLTSERMNDAVAEPVVYMMDRYVVGGFYRMHPGRGMDENLNAPGSSFVPLAFAHSAQWPQPGVNAGVSAPNRFYMYGVIARLALLAASYELEATDPQAETDG